MEKRKVEDEQENLRVGKIKTDHSDTYIKEEIQVVITMEETVYKETIVQPDPVSISKEELVEGSENQQVNENDISEGLSGAVEPELTIFRFTDEQREILLDEAKVKGFWRWLDDYGHFGLPSLFPIFGVECPPELYSVSPEEQLPLLRTLFNQKALRRTRLTQYKSFEDAVQLICRSKNIMVLTGAGVSVSCGIPDFRSKNGIYSRLSEFELSDPQEMFDLEYFKFRPETFYAFAKEIYPSNFKPSPSHLFIKKLEEKGKLLRNYTQNIDTLENIAGIKKVVQCHGSFATATCIRCKYQMPGSAIEPEIFSMQVPQCPKCVNQEGGIIKPDIVFFGENLPSLFHDNFAEDRNKIDLLIVMGSSLKVAPVANVTHRIPASVPQILINMESLKHMEEFDIHLLGYSDNIVSALLHHLGWENDDEVAGKRIPSLTPTLNIDYKQGNLPWHWLFEGAIEQPEVWCVSSEGEVSDTSSLTTDSEEHENEETEETDNRDDVATSFGADLIHEFIPAPDGEQAQNTILMGIANALDDAI